MLKLPLTITILFSFVLFFNGVNAQPGKTQHGSSIIAKIDFENQRVDNSYSPFDLQTDFGTMLSLGTFLPSARVKIVNSLTDRGKVLRVKYPKGKLRSYASGASWQWKNFGKYHDLYLSFWVKFEKGFNFRAGGKLHGLCGGDCNTGGKKPNGHDGWSNRIHWGPGNTLKNYVYHKDQPGKYGQVFFWTHNPPTLQLAKGKLNKKISVKQRVEIKPGIWYHVETRVKLNKIGSSDGIVQSWLNGELVLDVRGFEFRDKTCKDSDLLIDTMYFSTFFGGNSPKYMPVKDEYAYFDEFIISKELYIPAVFLSK